MLPGQLAEIANLRRLRYLFLYKVRLPGHGLRGLERAGKLESLRLWGTKLPKGALRPLESLDSLRSLELEYGTVLVQDIQDVLLGGNLKELTLSDVAVQGHARPPRPFRRVSQLRVLVTNGDHGAEPALAMVSQLVSLRRLKVHLPDRLSRQQDQAFAASLRTMRQLRSLSLHGGVGLETLKAVASLPELLYLSLSGSLVDDRAVAALASSPRLQVLDISSRTLGAPGLRELAKIQTLIVLRLSGARVADAGLLPLVRHPGLRHLVLENTQTSIQGIKALRKQLPRARLILKWDGQQYWE